MGNHMQNEGDQFWANFLTAGRTSNGGFAIASDRRSGASKVPK